jgi:hypothetical protein
MPGPPGARAARYAAVAMAAIAALLAFRFPLAGLWSPRTYQVTPHVRAEREALALIPAGTTVESTLTMLAPLAARDGATWIGTAGNPVPRYVAYDADNSGYAHPARRRPRLHQLALSRRDLSDGLQGGRRLPLPPYRERVAVCAAAPAAGVASRKPAAAVDTRG